MFNPRYLTNHGFSTTQAPQTMLELTAMMTSIVQNERNVENWPLQGFTGDFSDPQELILWASELNHGVNGSLIDSVSGLPIVYSDKFAEVVSMISGWLSNGLFDSSAIDDNDPSGQYQIWKRGDRVFIRASPEIIKSAVRDDAPFGMFPWPLYSKSAPYGVGTLEGAYISANRYSKQQSLSVRALEYLTSIDYQKQVSFLTIRDGYLPTYPSLLLGKIGLDRFNRLWTCS